MGLSAYIGNPFFLEDVKQLLQRIEEPVHHPLFERDDRVFRNGDRLRTYLPAARGDVTVTDIVSFLQVADTVFAIERMHFEGGSVDQEPGTDELVFFVVFAQDVTYILTQETLDALAKLLHPFHVGLLHPP